MADKLEIYKGVALLIGSAAGVASLTENSSLRHNLDAAWDTSVQFLLEKGLWNFAMRSVSLDNATGSEPAFGYSYAFTKPVDWVRTASISAVGTFNDGFEQYVDEVGFWYADVDPLFVKYISNDASYGLNITRWRQGFAQALEAYLAFKIGLPVSADRGVRNDMYNLFKTRLRDAKSLDAVDERVRVLPAGRLVKARISSRNVR